MKDAQMEVFDRLHQSALKTHQDRKEAHENYQNELERQVLEVRDLHSQNELERQVLEVL
jgi:hypothetical protein